MTLKQVNYDYLFNLHSKKELQIIGKKLGETNVTEYKKDDTRRPLNKDEIVNIILNNPKYKMKSETKIKKIFSEKELETKNKYYKELPKRLYIKTIPKTNNNYIKPCLLFGTNSKDYSGQIKINNKAEMVYRVSYALYNNIFVEDIPKYNSDGEELQLCHGKGCDKTCIEPTHLELKTRLENMYDDKIRDNTLLKGEKHHNSLIDEEMAKNIINSKINGKTQKQRANEFNVSIKIVEKIDSGASWCHLTNIDNSHKREITRLKIKNNKNIDFSKEDCISALKCLKEHSKPSKTLEYEDTPCDIFEGFINKSGYGEISFKGIPYIAHILSAEAYQGKKRNINENLKVRHLCNNKSCVNPLHLRIGTHSENMVDAINNGSKVAKLTEHQVRYIKLLLKYTKITQKDIGIMFNVKTSAISSIKREISWKRILYDIHPLAKIICNYFNNI